VAPLKRDAVAGMVRDMIADGTLSPGASVPSGAALARKTGYCTLTCRGALRSLLADGSLTRGASATARLRVAAPGGGGTFDAGALRVALSKTLASRRRAAGMTQPDLAGKLGVSVTTVGHAETGRVWQARGFWLRAGQELGVDGGLLRMFDRYKAAEVAGHAAPEAVGDAAPEEDAPGAQAGPLLPASVAITPDGVLVTWPDGMETLVTPPGCQGRPEAWQPGG
jgi:transcriptional regulator with XRE-family HTH domain